MRFKVISVLVFVLCAAISARAGDFDATIVDDALERAKSYEKRIQIPDTGHPEANKAAREAVRRFYSPERQENIQAEIERLKRERFADVLRDYAGSAAGVRKVMSHSRLAPDERIYIFISSSVPESTLRTYAAALDELGDPNISMVLRGFIDGMKLFGPTLDFVRKIIVKDPCCDPSTTRCDAYKAGIVIDPLLYRAYRIETVPTIAYVRGVALIDPQLSEGIGENLAGPQEAYIVRGDVSLGYALEQIRRKTKSESVGALLRKLQGGFYDNTASD